MTAGDGRQRKFTANCRPISLSLFGLKKDGTIPSSLRMDDNPPSGAVIGDVGRMGRLTTPLKTPTKSPSNAGKCPPSSVGFICIAVPAPSTNVGSQFILDIERYEGISSTPDLKLFASIMPSPTVPYSIHVSMRRQCLHQYTLGCLFQAAATATPILPVHCVLPISPLEMLSMVTPSSPVQSPTLRKNVQMTSSLASISSKALVPTI